MRVSGVRRPVGKNHGRRLLMAVLATFLAYAAMATPAAAQTPPFAAVQYGTNGCIEVGARPDPPFNQPKPYVVPADFDVTGGYPAFGYDPSTFTQTTGTNSCRYNFRNNQGVVIGSAYCVEWATGQRSGTGYDPQGWNGTIRNAGFVRRILTDYWPATNAPAVPSTNPTVINRLRSGTVAMAIHYFTDGVVMPPNYQDQTIYNVVRTVVDEVLAKGPLPEPPDPTPTIDGPDGGVAGTMIGPYTIGANATGDVTVTVTGASAYTDSAGTQPFTGGPLPPGGQLWISAPNASTAAIHAEGPVVSQIGTLMVSDPAVDVQAMMLAQPLTLNAEADRPIDIVPPPVTPKLSSRTSADHIEVGQSVTDRLTVVGLLAGSQATLTVTLYGPVARPAGGCAGVDWTDSGVPIARTFAAESIVGDDSRITPAIRLTEPGCYSYGATLDPAVGDTIIFPPGEPTETLTVVPQLIPPVLAITTRTSATEVDAGTAVSDHVMITGLLPGRTVTVTPRVFGPVPPVNGGCAGVDWLAVRPPVLATLPPRVVTGAVAFDTPAVTLTAPGCYAFVASAVNTQVTGGEVRVDHGLAYQLEIVLVRDTPVLPDTHGPRLSVGLAGAVAVLTGLMLIGAARVTRGLHNRQRQADGLS